VYHLLFDSLKASKPLFWRGELTATWTLRPTPRVILSELSDLRFQKARRRRGDLARPHKSGRADDPFVASGLEGGEFASKQQRTRNLSLAHHTGGAAHPSCYLTLLSPVSSLYAFLPGRGALIEDGKRASGEG